MKLRTSRDALLRPLRVVTGVVERRPTLPVLANLHIEATDSTLTVRGTDLEVEIVAKIDKGVEIEDAGSTTVPAHKLAEIWQSLPENASVEMALESGRAILRSGRSRFALATIPSADFPKEKPLLLEGSEEEGESVRVALQHADLRRLLDRTKFAMANGDVRYFLNGMLFELTASSLRAAASDGHRMAISTLNDAGVEGVEKLRSSCRARACRIWSASSPRAMPTCSWRWEAGRCAPPKASTRSPRSWWTGSSRRWTA